MKIFIINTDYILFLKQLYEEQIGLSDQSYEQQLKIRNKSLFGSSDFYSYNLNKLGYEAVDCHYNNYYLQSKWAEENINREKLSLSLKKCIYNLTDLRINRSILSRIFKNQQFPLQSFLHHILNEQIETFKPDVILNQALCEVPLSIISKENRRKTFIVGQIASPLPSDSNLIGYNLLISSLPNFVEKFKKLGIPAQYLALGFESRILDINLTTRQERDLPIVFIGSITAEHEYRRKLLEYLCETTDIQIWGRIYDLPKISSIYNRYNGEAWGKEMYKILLRTQIALNVHIDLSENYANNMRLFEATGCGALLLTDQKTNLSEFFEIDNEIITYSSPEECALKIQKHVRNESERLMLSENGQKRTLIEHTYLNRMQELSSILESRV